MKNYRILALCAVLVLAAACGKNARVSGVLEDSQNDTLIVRLLSGTKFVALDTLATSSNGSFSCKVPVEKGQPEFVYIFDQDNRQLAAIIAQKGDKIGIEADKSGNYTVTGSEESLKLQQVEKEFSEFMAGMKDMDKESDVLKSFIDYYRNSVKYVMNNPFSLSVIPVFFHEAAPGVPVFSQNTDALIFKSVADSLSTVYPESKYVKSLLKEAEKRMNALEFSNRLMSAQEINFPEIEMPDVNGKKVKLSEVDSKAVLIYFWTSLSDDQKMTNIDFLKPLYDDFHGKGLEIYAVSLDPDKASWARIVKGQKLPWINVNDGKGTSSPCLAMYGVKSVPRAVLIVDGKLVPDVPAETEAELRRFLTLKLK